MNRLPSIGVLGVLGVLGVIAGCADATGILVTAKPVDQAVLGADTLRVYVGRETVVVSPAIAAHFDDDRAEDLAVGSFTTPQDILLTGDGGEPEFWIVVRAYDDGLVVGEGGLPFPLALVAGEVHSVTVDVHRVENEPTFMPNCPGGGELGDRYYIVNDLDLDDCDSDGDPLSAGDCDDFDASVNAQTATRPCVTTDAGMCVFGTTACGGGSACVPSPSVDALDQAACERCEGSSDPLLLCLRDALPIARCDIDYNDAGFCVPSTQSPISPTTWHADYGPQEPLGSATWLFGRDGLDYGWIEGGGTYVSRTTFFSPPWPAVKSPGLPIPVVDGEEDTLLLLLRAAGGVDVSGLVDFRYHYHGTECPIDPEPDCSELPMP